MNEQSIPLKDEQRRMLETLLSRSNIFADMGFRDTHYVLIDTICKEGHYFPWDREILNKIRERYILWFIESSF